MMPQRPFRGTEGSLFYEEKISVRLFTKYSLFFSKKGVCWGQVIKPKGGLRKEER